jgi:hypothetical protein
MSDDKSNAGMGKPLNQQNVPWLFAVLLVNVVVFYLVIQANSLRIVGFGVLLKEWQSLLPAGLGAIVVGVLTAQFSEDLKASLVFWRWNDPLPGCRAITKYGPQDPRYTMEQVKIACGGNLPSDPREQNALWYRLYRKVADRPRVHDTQRNYLFNRDYSAISILLVGAFGGSGFWFISSPITAVLYLGLLIVQYLLVRTAAKNYGINLVKNVLAEIVSTAT